MKSVLQHFLVGGRPVWVEVDEVRIDLASSTAGTVKTARGPTAAQAVIDGADIATTLDAVIEPIRSALDRASPDEVTIEVSLGFKGEVGVFLAKSEGSASLKVTAKWKSK